MAPWRSSKARWRRHPRCAKASRGASPHKEMSRQCRNHLLVRKRSRKVRHSEGILLRATGQMPFGKGPPGSRLEIALELDGPLPVAKGNGVLDAPGFEFRGMRHFPGIVPAQTVLKVVGQPDIETGGIRLALENVNVGKIHFLACRVVVRSAQTVGTARFRPKAGYGAAFFAARKMEAAGVESARQKSESFHGCAATATNRPSIGANVRVWISGRPLATEQDTARNNRFAVPSCPVLDRGAGGARGAGPLT